MSLKKDKSIFEKFFIDGCKPSPIDTRDYTLETIAMAASPLPKTYLSKGMKVLNQGSVGSCVAHACATAMGYGELKGGMLRAHDFSRGFIYGNRKDTDHQGEGMYIRQALKQLNHCGDCQYAEFPYNQNYPSVKKRIEDNKDKLFNAAQPYKILNYFRCYTEDEVKTALLNQGAVIISIPLYSSFAAECPMPSKNDTYKGGHAMCVVGWDETGWIVQNSWSKVWGNKGKCHLPYEYPINEFWGVTVNPDVPTPKKRAWWSEVVAWWSEVVECIKSFFNNIIKRIFKRK